MGKHTQICVTSSEITEIFRDGKFIVILFV